MAGMSKSNGVGSLQSKRRVEYKDIKSRREFDYLLKNRLIDFTTIAKAGSYNDRIRKLETFYSEMEYRTPAKVMIGVAVLFVIPVLYLWIPWIIIAHILYWIIPSIFFIDFDIVTYFGPLSLLVLTYAFASREELQRIKKLKKDLAGEYTTMAELYIKATQEIEATNHLIEGRNIINQRVTKSKLNMQFFEETCDKIIDDIAMTVPRDFTTSVKNSLTFYVDDNSNPPHLIIWNNISVTEDLFLQIWRACGKPLEDLGVQDDDNFGKRGEYWSKIKSDIMEQNIAVNSAKFEEFTSAMLNDLSIVNQIKDNHADLFGAVMDERIVWSDAKNKVLKYGEHESLIRRWANGEKLSALLVEMDLD